ncbi:MAG: hypothetical protein JWO77_1792 [Ilumatobacteraceae bacterium]|nr:hypothetical protein [Ilumatobacteraceae bacterium]
MSRIRLRIERLFDRSGRPRAVTGEDRQVFFTLATSLLGREATEGSSFDDDVRAAITVSSGGAEATALEDLARSVRDRHVEISIEELSTFGRCARAFGVADDRWTFLGERVAR